MHRLHSDGRGVWTPECSLWPHDRALLAPCPHQSTLSLKIPWYRRWLILRGFGRAIASAAAAYIPCASDGAGRHQRLQGRGLLWWIGSRDTMGRRERWRTDGLELAGIGPTPTRARFTSIGGGDSRDGRTGPKASRAAAADDALSTADTPGW